MYLEHFGLREYPFGLTPDTRYFFPGAGSQAALNTLLVALAAGEGLIKIVGEVGSGKTMVCRHLLNTLEAEGWAVAFLPNPDMGPQALLRVLLAEMGGQTSGIGHLVLDLQRRLLNLARGGQRAVALIDEAQAMPLRTLETLRLISNLETERRKLLQIVLFGQPELDRRLADPSVRQIRSRIAFHDRIRPLNRVETPLYIAHRLRQAGTEADLFTPSALRALHRLSGGIPRLLNILAHKALLAAFAEGTRQATPRHVRLAGLDTETAHVRWFDRWLMA